MRALLRPQTAVQTASSSQHPCMMASGHRASRPSATKRKRRQSPARGKGKQSNKRTKHSGQADSTAIRTTSSAQASRSTTCRTEEEEAAALEADGIVVMDMSESDVEIVEDNGSENSDEELGTKSEKKN